MVKGDVKTPDALVSAVLLSYFEARTDKKPSGKQSRSAGRTMLKCWGNHVRVKDLTEDKQEAFVQWCEDQGFSLTYAGRVLTVLKSALNHVRILPPYPVITTESKMRGLWGFNGKAPRASFIPTDEQMLRIWNAEMPDRLRRWMVITLLTACRPSAALDLSPASLTRDAGLANLNPAGRVQNKKYRATVRATRVLSRFLDKWERGGLAEVLMPDGKVRRVYCGYTTIEGVNSAFDRLRPEIDMPDLTPYSFRHKAAAIIRKARGGEDQVALQLGHRRKDLRVTAGYGEFDPDYLAPAARALDAWALKLRRAVRAKKCAVNSHQTLTASADQKREAA
jgi:integrase